MKVIVTGGAGFIGSCVVRHLITQTSHHVLNLDKLTYAGNLDSVECVSSDPRYRFERVDINDGVALGRVFHEYQPDAIMHLAAESHVDRSIDGPEDFMLTNVLGTYTLLEAARAYWFQLAPARKAGFRFQHVSTDEVYGALRDGEAPFAETTPYAPHSPYSASKAASDHLVRAWHSTYGLPVVISNCSNNYGPYQFPEKLIPHIILSALRGGKLPVYGDGRQVRDWLYVEDHACALLAVLQRGRVGETYNIGGDSERRNLDVVCTICDLLDELAADRRTAGCSTYRSLITHVADRPGHDFRYAIDAGKIREELGWTQQQSFVSGLRATVRWYLDNERWWSRVLDTSYRLERIGRAASSAEGQS